MCGVEGELLKRQNTHQMEHMATGEEREGAGRERGGPEGGQAHRAVTAELVLCSRVDILPVNGCVSEPGVELQQPAGE